MTRKRDPQPPTPRRRSSSAADRRRRERRADEGGDAAAAERRIVGDRRAAPDRRVSPRVRLHVLVATGHVSGRSHRVSGDLSTTGIRLTTALPCAAGTRVQVTFDLPAGERDAVATVSAGAEVVTGPAGARASGVGLRFTELAEADRKRIQKLVEDAVVDEWFK